MKRLLVPVFLAVATAALAAEEGGGAPHGGIPWGEIVKQAVNLAILVGVLVYFLKKPLSSFLKERSEMLRRSIDDAARSRAEAASRLAAIEARMSRLSGEVEAMNRRAEAEAAEEAQRLREATAAEVERIRSQARFTADQEVKKAREELRREAADLSARAAAEIVARSMTPADQERLVRENVEKIREIVE